MESGDPGDAARTCASVKPVLCRRFMPSVVTRSPKVTSSAKRRARCSVVFVTRLRPVPRMVRGEDA